jgi:hypothetical protein
MEIKLVERDDFDTRDGRPVRLTAKGRAAIRSALAAGEEVVIEVDQCKIFVTPPVPH